MKATLKNTCQYQRNDPKLLGFCIIFVVFAKVLVIAVCIYNVLFTFGYSTYKQSYISPAYQRSL